MTTLTMTFDEDELDGILLKKLKSTYVDHVTYYMHERGSEAFRDALLMVIDHYSIPCEYNAWYESIKEL